MGPSHGLQFLRNCPSMGPFHMVLSFRNILLRHRSHASGMATVPDRKSPPAWAPLQGLQLLLKFCSRMGSPWAAVSLRASPLARAWLSPQIAVWIILLQHQPQCKWPTCISMVFSKGQWQVCFVAGWNSRVWEQTLASSQNNPSSFPPAKS